MVADLQLQIVQVLCHQLGHNHVESMVVVQQIVVQQCKLDLFMRLPGAKGPHLPWLVLQCLFHPHVSNAPQVQLSALHPLNNNKLLQGCHTVAVLMQQ